MPQATTGPLYSPANLTCRAISSPFPLILWFKDNKLIINKNTDLSVLMFTELTLSDRRFYHCKARNIINGTVMSVNSSKVLLNITCKETSFKIILYITENGDFMIDFYLCAHALF